jgi:hypothetical protein
LIATAPLSRIAQTAALLLGLGLSGTHALAEPDAPADAVVQLPPSHTQAQDSRVLVAAARNVVNLVTAAAQTLTTGDAGEAGPLLGEARRLLDQIQASLAQSARGGGGTGVIPVGASIDLDPGAEADPAVMSRIEALEPLMMAGEQERVIAGLQEIGTPLTYEYVGMPVQLASEGIDQANAALAAGQPAAAAEALDGVMRGLEGREVSITPTASPIPAVPVALDTPGTAPAGNP